MRSMARLLGHSPSTVSREIKRNGGYDRYRAAVADENAWVRARRPKRCKLANNPRLRRTVVGKLRSNWSPEQIAGWLKRAYPENEHYHVSHETIYRSLYIQTRGVLKKELLRHLRSNKDTQTVVSALIRQAKTIPNELYKSRPGTGAKSLQIIDDLRWRPTSTSTSAIRKVRGSVGQMRIPMVY
jgi:IS30 family transposase